MSAGARPRLALAGILIGKRLRLQLIGEMLDIAQQHEEEASPFKRKRLVARFNALHALISAPEEARP